MVTVGASDNNFQRADFSNFGDCVKVYASGTNSVSVLTNTTDQYTIKQGTSQAAPLVTGVLALIMEDNPNAKIKDVFNILKNGSLGSSVIDNKASGSVFLQAYMPSDDKSNNIHFDSVDFSGLQGDLPIPLWSIILIAIVFLLLVSFLAYKLLPKQPKKMVAPTPKKQDQLRFQFVPVHHHKARQSMLELNRNSPQAILNNNKKKRPMTEMPPHHFQSMQNALSKKQEFIRPIEPPPQVQNGFMQPLPHTIPKQPIPPQQHFIRNMQYPQIGPELVPPPPQHYVPVQEIPHIPIPQQQPHVVPQMTARDSLQPNMISYHPSDMMQPIKIAQSNSPPFIPNSPPKKSALIAAPMKSALKAPSMPRFKKQPPTVQPQPIADDSPLDLIAVPTTRSLLRKSITNNNPDQLISTAPSIGGPMPTIAQSPNSPSTSAVSQISKRLSGSAASFIQLMDSLQMSGNTSFVSNENEAQAQASGLLPSIRPISSLFDFSYMGEKE